MPEPTDPLLPELDRPPLPLTWRDRLGATLDQPGLRLGPVAAAVLGVVLVGAVAWWLLRPAPVPVERTLPMARPAGATGGTGAEGVGDAPGAAAPGTTGPVAGGGPTGPSGPTGPLVVAAAGAVNRPGVYEVPAGSRVDDVVRAAGGLAPDADGDRLNLAAPVADGQRVFVPRPGQTEVPAVGPEGGAGPVAGAGGPADPEGAGGPLPPTGPVDLNSATEAQLDELPGVGPATAQAILSYRQQHGPFRSVDELLEVRGIGDAKLDALRDLVTVS